MVSDTKLLDGWETWGCGLRSRPRMIEELTGGHTNRSYLLDADGGRLVIRVNTSVECLPGIDRARETRIWRAASDAKIAPRLLFIDPKERFVLTEYLEGQAPDSTQLDDSSLDQLFALLAETHNLVVDVPPLDYSLYIRVHWEMIDARSVLHNTALERRRQPMQDLLAEFIASKPATGLCHHDPIVSNLISSDGQLYLLDWEYAAPGFIAMDYAALSVDWNIADAIIVERSGLDPKVLDMAKQLYTYICQLWQEISPGVRHPSM
jgi:thiamine kinase